MKRLFFFFLFCLSMTAVAQNQINRVAILEVVDKLGTVSYLKLLQFRSNLTTAITNTEGYEGYDRADLKQIIGEQNFQRTGLVSDADIKKIGEFTGAQYVLIAEAAIDGTDMFITAKIIDVESARVIRNSNQLMGTSAAEMQEGSKKVAAELLGVSGSWDKQSQTFYQAEEFVISKKLLQERGFRFPSAQQEAIATLRTSKGDVNITCATGSASDLNNARCYGATFEEDCYINGLVLLKRKNGECILGYIVCGSMAYPYMTFRYYKEEDRYFVGVQEIRSSYGCAFHPIWDSSDERSFCIDMKKILGDNITTSKFIQEVTGGQVYLPELQHAFEEFFKRGGSIHKVWWGDDD